jgi:hypothetical protein
MTQQSDNRGVLNGPLLAAHLLGWASYTTRWKSTNKMGNKHMGSFVMRISLRWFALARNDE